MAAAGKVVVQISPIEAHVVAAWLRSCPAPLIGVPRINAPMLPNGVRLALVKKLSGVDTRARSTGRFKLVDVEIDRDDARWLGAKVSGGMFGASSRLHMPPAAREFCARCHYAASKKIGRRRLFGDNVQAAISRQRAAIEDHGVDPRHAKRLTKRERMNRQMENDMERWRASLAPAGDEPNLP